MLKIAEEEIRRVFDDNWMIVFSIKTCVVGIRQGDSNEYPQHSFLWRNKQNYPLIMTKYPPYLFYWESNQNFAYSLLYFVFKHFRIDKTPDHNVQIIGMSATLPNLDLLAAWLNADLYRTDYRPVPLTECFKMGTALYDSGLNLLRDIDTTYTVKVILWNRFFTHICHYIWATSWEILSYAI